MGIFTTMSLVINTRHPERNLDRKGRQGSARIARYKSPQSAVGSIQQVKALCPVN